MCFYVNLRELWPFESFFSRVGTSKPSVREKEKGKRSSKNNNNDGDGAKEEEKTDVEGGKLLSGWNGTCELAPHWLTTEKKKRTGSPILESSIGQQQQQANSQQQQQQQRHYGRNLLASLLGSGGALFQLDAGGVGPLEEALGDPSLGPTSAVSTMSSSGQQQQQVSLGQPSLAAETETETKTKSKSTTNNQEDIQNNKPKPSLAQPVTQQQQQQQQELQSGPSNAPEPSQQALAEAARFRVRTKLRRHLDFDDEYDLDNLQAPQRSKWSGAFHFIQAADCQFGMIDSYVHHRTEPGWREEIELCERLVQLCHQMQPKPLFMIICGDLVDSLPTSDIGRRQVVDFKRIFAKLDPTIPLVCVCGNHDVGDVPTSKTVQDYKRTFGEDYFYFTKSDILFIVINSQFYQNRDHVQAEAREQDQWLEGLLAKCRLFKYSIIFEHIPWFLAEAHEDDDYFNIRKEVRLEWLRKFKAAGVTKIMCGHYHRNAGGWFEGMELVVTSAIGAQCGTDRSGVRIVRVLDKSIEHQYYAMEEVPQRIELGE